MDRKIPNNNWRAYVKKIQNEYIANGYPITYQQAMIIAKDYYEKGAELEKQKEPEIKKENVPELKTVNKEPKKREPKKKKSKKYYSSSSDSDSEDEEYLEYLKLKKKYNKKIKK